MSIRTPRLSTVRSGISSALGKYWAVKGDSSSSSAGSDLVAADAERTPLFTRILVYAFRTELATGVTTIKLRVAYLYEVAQKRPSGHGRSKSPLAALLDESARRGRLKLSAEQAELLYDGSHCSPPMPGHSQTEDKRLIVTFYNATKVEVWDDLDVYLLSRDGTHHVCMQVGYEVEFAHELNLRDFPFDAQHFPIEMMLKFEDSALFAIKLYYVECHKSCLQLNEYSMLAPSATEQSARQTDLMLNYVRKPAYWMVSFFLPLAALMRCSLLVFLLSAFDMSDRMSLTFTFLLTVVSFRALLRSMLPRLGYFTMLDHYINASTLFAFFVAVASSVVLPAARAHTAHGELDEQLVHTWDARLLRACLLLYVVLHARFVVEARRLLQRAVIALGERDSWACFQFIDTFFQPLPVPR